MRVGNRMARCLHCDTRAALPGHDQCLPCSLGELKWAAFNDQLQLQRCAACLGTGIETYVVGTGDGATRWERQCGYCRGQLAYPKQFASWQSVESFAAMNTPREGGSR